MKARERDQPGSLVTQMNCQNFGKNAERYFPEIFGKDVNIPSVRSIIVPKPGHVIIECDYSQAELFTIAWLGDDPVMKKVLTTPGMDLHTETGIGSFSLKRCDSEGRPADWDGMLEVAKTDKDAFNQLVEKLWYKKQDGSLISHKVFEKEIRPNAKPINFGKIFIINLATTLYGVPYCCFG